MGFGVRIRIMNVKRNVGKNIIIHSPLPMITSILHAFQSKISVPATLYALIANISLFNFMHFLRSNIIALSFFFFDILTEYKYCYVICNFVDN